ncbi:hypothetical protein AN958_01771 [Leucoagaricus sp. SymC.cos]|nr:hypothetical protein AN958_01771 [Leucoagaricus sp. SymC.cos]
MPYCDMGRNELLQVSELRYQSHFADSLRSPRGSEGDLEENPCMRREEIDHRVDYSPSRVRWPASGLGPDGCAPIYPASARPRVNLDTTSLTRSPARAGEPIHR